MRLSARSVRALSRSASHAVLVTWLACAACSRREEPPPLPTETPVLAPSRAATSPSGTAAPPTGSASDSPSPGRLPMEEDFEEESASKITPETLDAQLDALEREIQGE